MENLKTYTCKRCGYCSTVKKNVIQHLNRKNTCVATLQDISREELIEELTYRELNEVTYNCKFCQKAFNSQSSRSQHHRRCKNREDKVEKLANVVATLLEQNNELKKELETIKAANTSKNIATGNGSCTTNNGTMNNVTNNIQVNVQLREFGQENYDAIPPDLVRACFMGLDIRTLLENLHFDKNFPENHNVRIANLRNEIMEWYRNSGWYPVSFKRGINELIVKACQIFKEFYRNNPDEVIEDVGDEEALKLIDTLEGILRLDEKITKPVREELTAMLYGAKVGGNCLADT